jgi:hypothetical protein
MIAAPTPVPMLSAEELRIQDILAKMKPSLRDELEELKLRVDRTINNQSSSYVQDAKHYALLIKDYIDLRLQHAQAIDNLSSTQDRCNELLEENRALQRRIPPEE